METLGLIFLFATLLILRQSVIVILFACTAYAQVMLSDGEFVYLIEDIWIAMDSTVLLAVPIFILAGGIMSKGSIALRLIDLVRALTEWLPGGLGAATIISCAVYAAINGSSAATLLAIGPIMYPALLAAGYNKSYSLGAITSAGTLGVLIPPSVPIIIYAVITETSIVDLFKAAVIPGLILTSALVVYSVVKNRHIERISFSKERLKDAFLRAFWAIWVPVIMLGGIYMGYFSPTEAAAIAVVYAFLVEILIYRSLTFKDYFDVGVDTARIFGKLFPIVAVALSIKTLLAVNGVPAMLSEWVGTVISSKTAFLISMNILLLIAGCLIEGISAILLLGPVLFIIAQQFDVHPVHFGIMMIINLEIGLLTPPLGLNLLVAMTSFKEKFWETSRSVLPFIAIMFVVLVLVTFIPQLSLLFL